MAKIVFDIDGTLMPIKAMTCGIFQCPDFDLIQVLRWFVNNGDEVFVWSGGGVEYAQNVVDRLGLSDMVKVIPKVELGTTHPDMDIAFDDFEVNLAKVSIKLRNENTYREKV